MFTQKRVGPVTLLLLALMLSLCALDAAQAQERWPPWQSYGEAESSKHVQAKRRAKPTQNELDTLNRQVDQLRKAGKLTEATFAAHRALRLTEQLHGADSVATADALTTVADLYIAQGKLAEAEPLLKRTVGIHERAAHKGDVAVALDRLAGLYDKQGRGADAQAARGRAGEMRGGELRRVESQRPAAEAEARKAEAERLAEEARRGAEAKRLAEERAAVKRDEESILAKKSGTGGVPPPEPQAQNAPAPEQAEAARPRARAYYRSAPPPAAASRGAPEPAPAPPPAMEAPAAAPPVDAPEMARSAHQPEEATRGAPEAMAPAAPPPPPEAESPTMAGSPPPGPAGAASGGAPTEEEKDFDVVPVFYGTDREVEPNAKRLAFGSDRARNLQLGRALVTVPKLHQVPNIERPWALHIPYFDVKIYEQAEDPKKHFTMQDIKKLSKPDFLALVRERMGSSSRFKDQALVFVHGFNTSFDNAVYRTAQIAYDLEFDGVPFLYSWPSGGGVGSYTYDRANAEAAKPYMRSFFETVMKESGAKSVNIIAHSMGNQPLLDVLKDLKSSAPEGVAINQVIFAAPDVDYDSFSDVAQALQGLAKGVTLYVASNDRALQISRGFWGYYRAGDVPPTGPLVLSGVDTIDITAASTDAFAINHSGYAQNNELLKDIGELIATGVRPPDLRHLKPERVETSAGSAYWRYAVRSR